MDDDIPTAEKVYPPTPSQLSKTPSWITLGFILGALFVWLLPREEKTPPPTLAATKKPAPSPDTVQTALTTLTTIEAVFEVWGKYAVWDNDTTEVALDAGHGTFSEFYEVKRHGDTFFYRSLTRLTRRPISDRRKIVESPLLFTETEEQYQNWLEHGRSENPVPVDTTTPPKT